MKRSRRELSIDMVIHGGIFKNRVLLLTRHALTYGEWRLERKVLNLIHLKWGSRVNRHSLENNKITLFPCYL